MAKRKTTPPKKSTKKNTKRKKKKNNFLNTIKKYLKYFLIFLLVSFIVFLISLIFFNNKKVENKEAQLTKDLIKLEKLLNNSKEHYEELTKELNIQYVEMPEEKEEKPKKKDLKFIFNDIKQDKVVIKKLPKKNIHKTIIKKDKYKISKPKLVIIIDDVTKQSQVNQIQALPYNVTMSFLPPTKNHKNSSKIAQNIKVAMIHLPLEASNRRHEEINTLHIEDSYYMIDKKIANLRKLYPNVKYINNHTGSKFTQNKRAMNYLIKSLKKHNYYFVDSRTTAKTVIKKYAKKYNLKYLSRNVFLDNVQEKTYIQKQLQQAVNIAKKKGFAIAIGHPYKITSKTIKESYNILKDVKVVYIDKLNFK